MTESKQPPIRGLGNDILEIERLRKSYEKHGSHFLNKLFSSKEQEYCLKHKDPIPHLAARFSVKESIAKAFGTGFGAQLSWLDIEISHDALGKPVASFSEKIQKNLGNPIVLISISHCKSFVATTAIWLASSS